VAVIKFPDFRHLRGVEIFESEPKSASRFASAGESLAETVSPAVGTVAVRRAPEKSGDSTPFEVTMTTPGAASESLGMTATATAAEVEAAAAEVEATTAAAAGVDTVSLRLLA